MWLEAVEWLKDPRLVARIQESFGVRIHYTDGAQPQNDSEQTTHRKSPSNDKSHEFENDPCDNVSLLQLEKKKANGYSVVKRNEDRSHNAESSGEKPDSCSPFITNPTYTITNYFWYYLFLFGTELGDEVFYSAFIPFSFWNVDAAVGRRVVLVWATVMVIGQALKDIICWPRPNCPPAVRLQNKWSQEYGMPSTHAMVGVSIPFSVVLFSINRYIYPISIGWIIASLWCALVSTSRLYLGMHTVLDVIAGLVLAMFLMIPLVPLVNITDYYLVSNTWALSILMAISIATIVYYPSGEKWTPTRGDTTMVVSVTTGVHLGTWLNYKSGIMSAPPIPPPYDVAWLTYSQLGCLILRTILGFASVVATKVVCKSLTYTTMCAILNVNSKDLMKSKDFSTDKNKVLVDLVYKYVTCFMIGLNTVYVLPKFFTFMGIERSAFYTEI